MKIGIIGGGKVGCCLAEYLQNNLVGITATTLDKSQSLATWFHTPCLTNLELITQAEVIFLTVPDRKIAPLAKELANTAQVAGKTFLHCSGSLTLEPLQDLRKVGAYCGSLHPLQSFAGGKTNLQNVYMAVDGDEKALEQANSIINILGGKSFYVPESERAAYHAAACFCSNYLVTIERIAKKLMSRWTNDEEAAWQALLPLFKGTVANLQNTQKPSAVLTGPIARGDAATIQKHLQALPPDYLPLYCSLGLETVHIAKANETIDAKTAQQLQEILLLTQNQEA